MVGRRLPDWLREWIEAIIWTLKHQLDLDRYGARIPGRFGTHVVQRLLAPNAVIQFNSQWPPFSSVGRRGWAKATDMVEDAFTAARRSTAPAPPRRRAGSRLRWAGGPQM
jgi:hypothetical protein